MLKSSIKNKISKNIDNLTENAADVLMELIRYKSVCGDEMGAVGCMKDVLEDAGFAPRIIPMNPEIKTHPEYTNYTKEPTWEDRGNLVTDYGGDGEGRSLILNAHLDVVPAEGWQEAYNPKREGNIIFGRGACDNKGGVVAGYLAMRALAECNVDLPGRLSLHHVIDEETGGNGTLSLLAGGYTADAAIVCEGTDNAIYPANRGALWFQLTVTGISTHMGEIDNGISALEKANQAIDILKDYEHYLIENFMDHPYFTGLKHRPIQLCIGMIKAGEWPSMVPERCEVEGGMGFLPNKDINDVKQEMRQWIIDRGDNWLREHFELRYDKLHNPAFEISPDHPFVTCIQGVAQEAGFPDTIKGWIVSCDARLYPRVADMPVVCAGPGTLSHAHSSIEQIQLSEIVRSAKLYAFTAIDWCGGEGE